MNELVRYENGVLVPVAEGEGGSLVTRPDGSVVPANDVARATASTASVSHRRMGVAVVAASLVAAVAVGAAAFAGGSGSAASGTETPGAARGSLAASASDSAAASSVAFTVSATETAPGTTSTLVSGSGSLDLAKGIGQMTATVPAVSSILGSGGDSSLTVISDGTSLYVNAPALSALTDGKSWLKTSAASASSIIGGSSASSLSLSTLTDPSQALALLGSLGGPVTNLGTVQLNGASATEYRTTLSVSGIAAHLGTGSASASADALTKALQKLGVPTVPVTVWVGQDGMVRQVSMAVDLSHATVGGLLGGSTSTSAGSSLAITVGFTHYGQPVSISVPPASEVTDLNGIIGSLKGTMGKVGSTVSDLISRV